MAASTRNNITDQFNLKLEETNGDEANSERTTTNAIQAMTKYQRQGRLYSHHYASQPGGLHVDDMIFGTKMAHISCTDDTPDRLKGSGANTLETLRHLLRPTDGQDQETVSQEPLTTLLRDQFGLQLDCWMDESGVRLGRPVDTQGFIASNEDTIVLSYRFSTSGLDWLTNLSLTSSEWEPDVDERIGHAGLCSCIDGWYTKYIRGRGKPRVHTGFYNNFIYTIPMIRKHIIEPLLQKDKDGPRTKVYVCGCSLGAAIAALAFCFLVEELPLEDMPHVKLINVTAGCPRVCDQVMRERISKRMEQLRPLDRAVICRMVYNADLVPHIPLRLAGFVHLDKLVYMTPEGDVLINPRLRRNRNFAELKGVLLSFRSPASSTTAASKTSATTDEDDDGKTAFERECESTPGPIKDHMPYWYLTCLEQLKCRVEGAEGSTEDPLDNGETEA